MEMKALLSDVGEVEKRSVGEQAGASVKDWMKQLIDPAATMSEEESKQYEQKILNKLKHGKRLSVKEKNYLKIHNPTLSRTAIRVELAKNQLKEQLKHSKSKHEANRVITSARAGVHEKDPDREYMLAGIQETAKNFRRDRQYARLPEHIEEGKKKKSRSHDFDDGEGMLHEDYSPIIEVMEALPTFDVMQ